MSLESIVEIYLLIFLSLAAFDPVHNEGEGGGAQIFQFEIPWIFYLIDKDRIQFKFMSKSLDNAIFWTLTYTISIQW